LALPGVEEDQPDVIYIGKIIMILGFSLFSVLGAIIFIVRAARLVRFSCYGSRTVGTVVGVEKRGGRGPGRGSSETTTTTVDYSAAGADWRIYTCSEEVSAPYGVGDKVSVYYFSEDPGYGIVVSWKEWLDVVLFSLSIVIIPASGIVAIILSDWK
jgi:hypothetical protein